MRNFITFSQVLNAVVGKLSDAASSTGSVLARLKYIIDTGLDASSKKYGMLTTLAHAILNQTTTVSGTYYTVCDITGSGFLYRASAYGAGGNSLITMRVTLDGNEYVLSPPSVLSNAMSIGSKINASTLAASMGQLTLDVIGPIKFATSLKVEVKQATTTNLQGYAQWGIDR